VIVAAIGVLAALAAADALRGSGDGERPVAATTPETTTSSRPPTLPEELSREAVTGIITYSDDQCLLHTLLLPSLEDELVRQEVSGAPIRHCAFSIGAGRLLPDAARVNPADTWTAQCVRGHVEVVDVVRGELLERRRLHPGLAAGRSAQLREGRPGPRRWPGPPFPPGPA
jgi:hypothetical protein